MNSKLSANWAQLRDKVDALSVRERLILAGAMAVLLLGIADQLMLRPWMKERAELSTQDTRLQAETEQLSQQMSELEAQIENDPNKKLKRSIEQLVTRHQQVDADIRKITDGMIAPELMPTLLGELLSERSGLKVQSIKTLPAEQLLTADKQNHDAPAIYRHNLELRLQGTYEQVQHYLQSIEEQPQKLVWDELTFSVDKYPKGELALAVHTLSAREELIRVSQ